jgi:hypothetical protein
MLIPFGVSWKRAPLSGKIKSALPSTDSMKRASTRHVMDVLESPRNTMQLVNLERDTDSDKLSHDRVNVLL